MRAITLTDLTDFTWERVVFLGPYTSRETANKALGFDWPNFEDSGIKSTDFYNLIVFAGENRVLHWWKLRRCAPDIDKSLNGIAVMREQAKFSLTNTEHCSVLKRVASMRSNTTPNTDARNSGARRLA